VFEAARGSLGTGEAYWEYLGTAAVLNIGYFSLCVWFFQYMYRRSRETGQFARNEE
jgi:hypothetical protein